MTAGAPIFQTLAWGLVGILAVLIVWWLLQVLWGGQRGEALAPEPPATEAVVALSDVLDEQPLQDAEALARDGRFAEAIRALLARTFEALRQHRGLTVERSRTGRELARSLQLSTTSTNALDALVLRVELALFGERATDRGDYEECVQHYRLLARTDAGEGTGSEA